MNQDVFNKHGVKETKHLALLLKKSLYGLKQAGRLWSKLLHSKLIELNFKQCTTDMCLYMKKVDDDIMIVGVYVDNLLVTGTSPAVVEQFFLSMASLETNDLGVVNKFLGLRILLDTKHGYVLVQEPMNDVLLNDHELELANAVRAPIDEDCNDVDPQVLSTLIASSTTGNTSINAFQSLVRSLLWIARYTRPDIIFAVHRETRRTHNPTEKDWKMAKRVGRYLKGTKDLKLCINRTSSSRDPINLESWSDADFAADKSDRTSVSGCVLTMDGAVVSWDCKKQTGVSLSTMEVEVIAASQEGREL